jgi:hypothetical protein
MESDTPRTDALVDEGGMPYDADFARKLERELAAAIKQREDARRWLRDACAEIARIETRFYDTLTPQQIAERNGWNCFSQKEGGGA